MHEAGIARELLKLALEAAGQAKLTRISAVEARGHGLSAGEVEAVRLHWALVAKGTAAEGSKLELGPAPARSNCLDCAWEGFAQGPACPQCGSEDLLEESAPTLALTSIAGE